MPLPARFTPYIIQQASDVYVSHLFLVNMMTLPKYDLSLFQNETNYSRLQPCKHHVPGVLNNAWRPEGSGSGPSRINRCYYTQYSTTTLLRAPDDVLGPCNEQREPNKGVNIGTFPVLLSFKRLDVCWASCLKMVGNNEVDQD